MWPQQHRQCRHETAAPLHPVCQQVTIPDAAQGWCRGPTITTAGIAVSSKRAEKTLRHRHDLHRTGGPKLHPMTYKFMHRNNLRRVQHKLRSFLQRRDEAKGRGHSPGARRCVNFCQFYTPHLRATGSRYFGVLWIRQIPEPPPNLRLATALATRAPLDRTREGQQTKDPSCRPA